MDRCGRFAAGDSQARQPPRLESVLVRDRFNEAKTLRRICSAAARLFEAQYQLIDIGHEGLAVGVRAVIDQTRRLLGQGLFPRHARPAPDFAIGQQSQPTQIAASARELQITEEILEAELQ